MHIHNIMLPVLHSVPPSYGLCSEKGKVSEYSSTVAYDCFSNMGCQGMHPLDMLEPEHRKRVDLIPLS